MPANTQPGSNGPATSKKTAKPAQNPQRAGGSSGAKKELKILMLHGYAQSGPVFRSKTGAMSKLIAKALPDFSATRIYPTGPHQLRPSDIPGFQPREGGSNEADADADADADAGAKAVEGAHGWFLHDEDPGVYRGFEDGIRAIADAVQEAGGVDGVLGFSQGGAVGALVAAALETDRELPGDEAQRAWARRLRKANGGRPLRFCVVYSGFVARPGAQLDWLYEGGIATPTCHFFGSTDTLVDESRSRALVERCVAPEVVVHPGGHHVPVRKEWVAPLLGFLKKIFEVEGAAETGSS